MPTNKKSDSKKKRRSPEDLPETTLGAVLFYAFFSGLGGVVLAFVFFASFTPQTVPDEATLAATLETWAERPSRPADSAFLRPQEGGAVNWGPKVAALTSGEPADVTLTAAELNNWMQAQVAGAQPVTGSHRFLLVPRRPGVALFTDGRLQFTLLADFHFFGKVHPLQFIAEGVVDGETARLFEMDRLRCNAAEVPPVPGLRGALMRRLLSAYVELDAYGELLDVLTRARTVETTAAGIRIVI